MLWAALVWWIRGHGIASGSWVAFAAELSVALAVTVLYSTFVVLKRDDRALWRLRLRLAMRG